MEALALLISAAITVTLLPLLYILRLFLVVGTSCKSTEKMNGKTVIITGANTGIGKETAIDLARRGAKVIIGCRNKEKALGALKDIKESSKSNQVFFKQLDLASLTSVRRFASETLEEEARIDVLINNAGVMFTPYSKTEEGFEMQFGVNHLGHYLLTMLLLERIKETPNSRIVVVSSLAHLPGYLDFDDMMWSKRYNPYLAYCRSKLANVMFANELSCRLTGTGVSVYSLHPGTIRTELTRHMLPGWRIIFRPILYLGMLALCKSVVQGSQTTIHCSVAKESAGISGKYWSECAVTKPSRSSQNTEDCKRLFEYSAKLVNFEDIL